MSEKQNTQEIAVVIRLMAAAYQRCLVEFTEQIPTKQISQGKLFVQIRNPYVNNVLTEAAKQAILDTVKVLSSQYRLRMCVVFAETINYYIEPDGTINQRVSTPSGGITIKYFN